METRLTLRKGIVGIIGDDDFNSGFLKLISKLWEIVIAPRQPIQSTNDNAIKGVSIQLGEQPLKFKTFRKNSWGIILETSTTSCPCSFDQRLNSCS